MRPRLAGTGVRERTRGVTCHIPKRTNLFHLMAPPLPMERRYEAMKKRRALTFLVSVVVLTTMFIPQSRWATPAHADGGLSLSSSSGVPMSSGAPTTQVTFTKVADCGNWDSGCYYAVRWDDPINGPVICQMAFSYIGSGGGTDASCSGAVPYDAQGSHTVYVVDGACLSSGGAYCTTLGSATYTIMGCNPNDTIHTVDANTYSIQPYAGFDPATASPDEANCYFMPPDMGGMIYDAPTGPDGAGAVGSIDSNLLTSGPSDGVEQPTAKVTTQPFNIWSGYADRYAQTQKSYTAVLANWKAPASAAPQFAELVWVGLGSGVDKNPKCDAAPGSVNSAFATQPKGYCLIQAGTATNGAGIDRKAFTSGPVQFWYENYPAQTIMALAKPVVGLGDNVRVAVSYAASTQMATYVFFNATTRHAASRTVKVADVNLNGAECVVEQGVYTDYGGYDAVPFRGCKVTWTNDPTNPGAAHGSAFIGSASDPGVTTDLYGPVGYAHNSLDANGNFTLTCLVRTSPTAGCTG